MGTKTKDPAVDKKKVIAERVLIERLVRESRKGVASPHSVD